MTEVKIVDWRIRFRMTQESKWSELHEVCANGDVDLLEEMLKSGKYDHINYKDPDWEDRSPLHWCCIKGKHIHSFFRFISQKKASIYTF